MKSTLLITILLALIELTGKAQCNFIPSTSASTDTLSYNFSGGSFQSYGCAPIEPTRWISGSGNSVTITFVNLQSNPSFRVWGMNDDDIVSVSVNGASYLLSESTASIGAKVICGISPGPDGVVFSGGNLVGANTNIQGNYSYQDVQLNATNVATITITGLAGNGWGFAGVSVNCPLGTGINDLKSESRTSLISPNPFTFSTTLHVDNLLFKATLTICDPFGRVVTEMKNISGQTVSIQRDNIPGGFYFLHLTQDNKTISTNKLIIVD